MRVFFAYLRELGEEVVFLILLLLGIGSTLSTYIPQLQDNRILKWFGLACIIFGFLGANFRLYRRRVAEFSDQSVVNLIDELEYNYGLLQNLKSSTSPALRDEVWKSASGKMLAIPDYLRTQLNSVYMSIRSAKEIQQSIQSVPLGANTLPELIEIERLVESAKQAMPRVIGHFRRIARSGKPEAP